MTKAEQNVVAILTLTNTARY